MSTSADFFRVIVEPTVNEYLRRRGDLRLGVLAAIVLNQMADYWAIDEGTASAALVRRRLRAQCPSFTTIADVSDATKHAKLTRGSRELTNADQISTPSGLFSAPFGAGVFHEAWVVTATFDDGRKHALDHDVLAVLAMWQDMLNRYT